MADKKITQLTANTSVASTDILPIVINPGTTPENRKVTLANLLSPISLSSGKVGISWTSPSYPLSVVAPASSSANNVTTDSGLSVQSSSSDTFGTYLRQTSNASTTITGNTFMNQIISKGGSGLEIYTITGTLSLGTGATERLQISGAGNVGVGTAPTISDGTGIHVNGKIIRLATSKTPASASATGNAGEICWDSNYIYVCTATNTWKRAALSTW